MAPPARDGLPRLVQLFPTDGCRGDTTIDIIAVHGIETHSPKTWIAYERDEEPKGRATNWLCDEDMLPKVIPQARIWAYDYNSNCYSDDAQHVDILGLGETFLEMLWGVKDKDVGMRSLIFIGSCFGGVVIAQTLERASQDKTKYAYLLRSTAGVVFLGTPLRGTRTASIAEWVAIIRGFMGKETSTSLLQSLKDNANSLDTLIHDFSEKAILHRFQIGCFYETRKTQIANALSRQIAKWSPISEVELVSKESACLDGHKRIPLEVRHAMMNKYRGPDDSNFKLVSGKLKEIVDYARISQGQTKEELKCLQCLTSNYRQHKDRNEKRVPGTCQWFLKHPKFLDWRQKDTANLLWVSADPGFGKSVLSRALVEEQLLSFDIRKSSVCYFFFKDDDTSRQSGADALCAILHQLFGQKPALLRHAMDDYNNNGKNLSTMFGELWDILDSCARDPEGGEIICVLDALDECRQPAREELIKQLSWFDSAQNKTNTKLKFVVTSRPYVDIERSFRNSINDMFIIRLKGEDESNKISKEIDLVIDYQVPRISKNRNFPFQPEVQNALIKHLKNMVHRTYLWLHLVLDIIQESLDSTRIRLERLINELPRTVEDSYEKILMKIHSSKSAKQARRLLHIVVAATRPLSLQEMNIALAIDEKLEKGEPCQSYSELDLEREDSFLEKIRNLCGLFVSIIDSKIYLIHQTAREFLVSKSSVSMTTNSVDSRSNCFQGEVWRHSLNLLESNLVLAKVCLSYLLFQELNRHIAKENTLEDPSDRFLNYAAEHWFTHYQKAGTIDNNSVLHSIIDLCDPQSNRFQRWYRVYAWWDGPRSRFYNPYSELGPSLNVTNLIIASYFGLEPVVKLLLERDGIELNFKDSKSGLNALSWAVLKGNVEVVKLLVEEDGIELNLENDCGRTALICGVLSGNVEAVKLLIEQDGIELNLQDSVEDQTALLWAVRVGNVEIVKLLVEEDGIELNVKDDCGRTALTWAILLRKVEVVKLLLEQNGIDLNPTVGLIPLIEAAVKGYTEVVKLLLEQDGIELNLKYARGRTALSWAAYMGHAKVVNLLLEQDGIELNLKDSNDRTLLSLAAGGGDTKVVKLLLEQGYDVKLNLKDSRGRTAISWAACGGYAEVVKLLLEQDGIELNLKDSYDRTLLSLAAGGGDTKVVKLLLEQGYDVKLNLKDCDGGTALAWAVDGEHAEVVKLLLEQDGIELNLKNCDGQTALSRAAYKGDVEVVMLLLEQDAIELNPTDGLIPLIEAAKQGQIEVIKLLLKKAGVKLNLKDSDGRTALSWASHNGHAEVAQLLLQQDGVKLNLTDSDGRTALSWASLNRHAEVAKLLLQQDGVELNFKDSYGGTALSCAAFRGYAEVVKLMLDKTGVEINFKDSHGRTALSCAAFRGYAEVVKLLLEHGGVELNLKTSLDRTALSWAAHRGRTEVVNLLLEQDGVELNYRDSHGRTALSLAVDGGHAAVVELLLKQGEIDLNNMDGLDSMLLIEAATQGYFQVVKLLLDQNGIELNLKDSDGQTALSWAVYREHAEVVKLLLEQDGIDLEPTITGCPTQPMSLLMQRPHADWLWK